MNVDERNEVTKTVNFDKASHCVLPFPPAVLLLQQVTSHGLTVQSGCGGVLQDEGRDVIGRKRGFKRERQRDE